MHCWGADARRRRRARLPAVGRARRQGAAPRGAAGGVDRPRDGGRRRGRRRRALAHLVRATSPATWPSSSTASRTWRRCTRSSRCGPWKAEQLGGGYALSSFCERTALEGADAVIAVSKGSREDILDVLPGASIRRASRSSTTASTPSEYRAGPGHRRARALRRRPGPRRRWSSSGASRARRACRTCCGRRCEFDPAAQLVLCAGAPDTPEIGAEVAAGVERLRAQRDGVFWIDRDAARSPTSSSCSRTRRSSPARRSTSRSGIVNLEAMACEAAVVATATGGIVEVVVDGETGFLVPFEQRAAGSIEPRDPDGLRVRLRRAGQRADRRPGAGASAMGERGPRRGRSRRSPGGRSPSRRSAVYRRLASGPSVGRRGLRPGAVTPTIPVDTSWTFAPAVLLTVAVYGVAVRAPLADGPPHARRARRGRAPPRAVDHGPGADARRAGLAAGPHLRAAGVGAHGPAPDPGRPRPDRAHPGAARRSCCGRSRGGCTRSSAAPACSPTRSWAWSPTSARCGSGTCPSFYDAALRHAGVHVLEHLTFAAAGFLYWWHLISPIRSRLRLGGHGAGRPTWRPPSCWSARSASP